MSPHATVVRVALSRWKRIVHNGRGLSDDGIKANFKNHDKNGLRGHDIFTILSFKKPHALILISISTDSNKIFTNKDESLAKNRKVLFMYFTFNAYGIL